MKKSFRLRLILQFIFCILLVSVLNRGFSQYFANQYVQERIEAGMAARGVRRSGRHVLGRRVKLTW